jgi:hypothetical protein
MVIHVSDVMTQNPNGSEGFRNKGLSQFHVVYLPREVMLILLMESKGITLYSLALGTSEPNYEWEY